MPEQPASVPPPRQGLSVYTWLTIVLGILLLLVVLYRGTQVAVVAPSSALQRMWIVPPFALTERSGRTISNKDLSGKIWIADFVYTTCPGPCPLITETMAKLQAQIKADPKVMLVTFTVDPQTDTPQVLTQYADAHQADPNRWLFLTGNEKQIYDLLMNGFKVAAVNNSDKPPSEGQYKVTHSTQIALVDEDGTVRGYYDGTGDEGRAKVLQDIAALEKDEKP